MTAVPPSTGRPSVERCALCGADAVPTAPGDQPARECAVCGWVVGDVPDAELPRPRVDVVYYLRWHDRIKIGTAAAFPVIDTDACDVLALEASTPRDLLARFRAAGPRVLEVGTDERAGA